MLHGGRQAARRRFVHVQDRVVGVPRLDARCRRNQRTDGVEGDELPLGEQGAPEFVRLFVDVMLAALARRGGGEEHAIAMGGEVRDDRPARVGPDVFRGFETLHEIEAASDRERPADVHRLELLHRNQQQRAVDVIAVHTEDVVDPARCVLGEPRARAASNVEDAAAAGRRDDDRHDRARRAERALLDVLVEQRVVGVRFGAMGCHALPALSDPDIPDGRPAAIHEVDLPRRQ